MINTKKLLAILLLGTLSVSGFYGCSDTDNDSSSTTLMLAHAMHPSHPVSVAMQRMADNLEVISGGELTVKIYTGGILGSERELLELIQLGTIDITKVSTATIENTVPAMQVFSLPYLFRDKDHVFNVLDGEIGQELLAEGIPSRLRGIAYYDAGSRSIYTVDRRVETPEDLRGLKMRVMESTISVNLMRNLGGSPTPISYGELYTAFQGGIVDGAENNPPSFYTSRHYEVCQYYIINEHATIPDLLVIGERKWNKLSEQHREWLMEAVNESVAFQRELWEEFTENAMEEIEASGVEIIYPDRQPFVDALQPMYSQIQENNPELYRWFERIRDVE